MDVVRQLDVSRIVDYCVDVAVGIDLVGIGLVVSAGLLVTLDLAVAAGLVVAVGLVITVDLMVPVGPVVTVRLLMPGDLVVSLDFLLRRTVDLPAFLQQLSASSRRKPRDARGATQTSSDDSKSGKYMCKVGDWTGQDC